MKLLTLTLLFTCLFANFAAAESIGAIERANNEFVAAVHEAYIGKTGAQRAFKLHSVTKLTENATKCEGSYYKVLMGDPGELIERTIFVYVISNSKGATASAIYEPTDKSFICPVAPGL